MFLPPVSVAQVPVSGAAAVLAEFAVMPAEPAPELVSWTQDALRRALQMLPGGAQGRQRRREPVVAKQLGQRR